MNIFKHLLPGIFIFSALSCIFFMPACKREKLRVPLENDHTPPGVVSHVTIERLPGGAKIGYSLPADMDLLYVEANYEIRPGIKEESMTSLYDHSLIVQGFGDTSEHQVELFAVDRSGNRSEAVAVDVKPLVSPVQQVYNSLNYEAGFGGIHVTFKNESQADVVVSVLIKDSLGDWVDDDKYYTSLTDGNFSVRGLPSVPTTFGVFVKDRWDNHSDTMVRDLTPIFEEKLDKTGFKPLGLPGDAENLWTIDKLWDDIPTSGGGFHSAEGVQFPLKFEFDLGTAAKLSRFRFWGVFDGREYSSSNIKHFQIWGSTQPASDGSFVGWTLLQDCEVVKPSGLPEGEISDEDTQTALAGIEFPIDPGAPPVRYIRFKIISTFATPAGGIGSAWVKEVTFWGQ